MIKQWLDTSLKFSKHLGSKAFNVLSEGMRSERFDMEHFTHDVAVKDIVRAAKQEDFHSMKNLLEAGNVSMKTTFIEDTLGHFIGYSLNKKELSALLRHGIPKSSLSDIVAGHAQRGGIAFAESLRKRYALNANQLAGAAIRGGHLDYANQLLQSEDLVEEEWLAMQAAQSGYFDYAKRFMKDSVSSQLRVLEGAAVGGWYAYVESIRKEQYVNIDIIAGAAALGGRLEYAELLHQSYGADIENIVYQAARGGHHNAVEGLRCRMGVKFSVAISGAARGGHHAYARFLLAQDPANLEILVKTTAEYGFKKFIDFLSTQYHVNPDWVAFGAMIGGDKAYAYSLREKSSANLNEIARAAMLQGKMSTVKECLDIGADPNVLVEDAMRSGSDDYVNEVVFSQRYALDYAKILVVAMELSRFEDIDSLLKNGKLSAQDVACYAIGQGEYEYAEKVRETYQVKMHVLIDKSLQANAIDYLLHIIGLCEVSQNHILERAMYYGRSAFADNIFNALKGSTLRVRQGALDFMVKGAIQAGDQAAVKALLGRGATKDFALYAKERYGVELPDAVFEKELDPDWVYLRVAQCARLYHEECNSDAVTLLEK
ncbi:MAG: hypothetical protein VYC40_03595 [Pseudomonadota bacterium]|nr:hypothetical protein [Pseudomonadota bacterium]